MLDLAHLQRIKLHQTPLGQLFVANFLLLPDYHLPRRTEIILEGGERISRDRPVFFAMNHTDRYNYWPFQYQLYRQKLGFTATWIKGKYYENPALALFLDHMNGIPLPSRGYLITSEFKRVTGSLPDPTEYRVLRDLVSTQGTEPPPPAHTTNAVQRVIGGDVQEYVRRFNATFDEMMREVMRITREAMERLNLHVLVFPEGTRSRRLSVGRTGLAQMTQHLGATILPVGCNGSDRLYPGNAPFSRGGRVIYRIGAPLEVDGPELREHRVSGVLPFSREAADHDARYQAITKVVMEHIAAQLDPEYRPEEHPSSAKVADPQRFV